MAPAGLLPEGAGLTAVERVPLMKAHAFGNDFLLVWAKAVAGVADLPAFARSVCDRHRGFGADGLIIVDETASGARTRLLNADGSRSEVSGNGTRCVAAWLAFENNVPVGGRIDIDTEAGVKRVDVLTVDGLRYTCRAQMGHPEHIRQVPIAVAGEEVTAVVLRVGNPQCVVLGPPEHLTEQRLHSIGAGLAVHPFFPEGTNVELASVEAPDRVRILIWERGVGPTEASGTGACGSAVAAASYGGASRAVDVVSPGGTQRVEWTAHGILLTGWADLIGPVTWLQGGRA
jgi:diaminopimelate epimerase